MRRPSPSSRRPSPSSRRPRSSSHRPSPCSRRSRLALARLVVLLGALLGASASHDVFTLGVVDDASSSSSGDVGDTTTPPARSTVGFVQDCAGFPPRQSGTLCGARGAFLGGHYLWVAATQVDAVTAVDLYRPDMPTVAGSVSDPVVLKSVVAVWVHGSNDYVVAVSRGLRPTGIGHVALVDIRAERWVKDRSGRWLARPRVLPGALRDCETSDAYRSEGFLCGSRGLAVHNDKAYVVSEMSNTLTVVDLPGSLGAFTRRSDLIDGEPTRIPAGLDPYDPSVVAYRPTFNATTGTLRDARLEGAYAIAVDGSKQMAFVASRWCRECVIVVDVAYNATRGPIVGKKILGADPTDPQSEVFVEVMEEAAAATIAVGAGYVGRLRGVEFVARRPAPEANAPANALDAFAFVTTEFDGRVSSVAAECARVSVEVGESVQYCATGARRGLYVLDGDENEPYEYRANARPNYV